jgi:2-succinyl-6-hydroxy-2,4-cyclohexadiene-1-carboxylate synthase
MEYLAATIRGITISYIIKNPSALQTVVLLHGFTGSTNTWNEVMNYLPINIRIIAIDLNGHGKSSANMVPERFRMEEQVEDIKKLVDHLNLSTFTLIGYSMGGRIALAYSCTYPLQVTKLLLESSSPGIENRDERLVRIKADERLAKMIENDGLAAFVDFWEEIPLFQSQKRLSEQKKKAIRFERMEQDSIGLASSLRGIGTGAQPSYWSRLSQLTLPVVCITGEFDDKFKKIAIKMSLMIKDVQHIEVLSAGHAIHVENPVQFATIIMEQVIDVI